MQYLNHRVDSQADTVEQAVSDFLRLQGLIGQ
jgi:hypothetical protein